MEVNKENLVSGGQDEVSTADSPEERSGVCISEAMIAEHSSSSEILRRYVKHAGISRKRTRHHCLTQELDRILIS
jgi:hypothetical protein